MNRRTFLTGVGAGSLFLAGCSTQSGQTTVGDRSTTTSVATDGSTPGDTTRTPNPRAQFRDVTLPVPTDELRRGASKNGIPAITDPAFAADWSDVESNGIALSLREDDEVIGVSRDGAARAYPLRVLDWHEIVNDEFGGPLLVTYCPLCGSGMTAVRRVNGEVTNFGVSGLLFRNDLVMFDELTESYWSQIMATAIRGELTGQTLELIPSSLTTWREWREAHPNTEVLLPPPESGTIVRAAPRPYNSEAYRGYDESSQIGIGGRNPDDRLHPKTEVIGVSVGETSRAYPLPEITDAGVVNDTVEDLPVVVSVTESDTLVAYVRVLDGETVTFERDGAHLRAAGSRFRILDGVAVDGPHEGTRLEQANEISPEFWFAWANFHPETEIYEN